MTSFIKNHLLVSVLGIFISIGVLLFLTKDMWFEDFIHLVLFDHTDNQEIIVKPIEINDVLNKLQIVCKHGHKFAIYIDDNKVAGIMPLIDQGNNQCKKDGVQ